MTPFENPHFYALDIILAYLNRGNTAPEITALAQIATTWCEQHREHRPRAIDPVLRVHPYLFDLSIQSYSRLFRFHDGHMRIPDFSPNQARHLAHIRPSITAQQYFSAMVDAYVLRVGRKQGAWWLLDRVGAHDLLDSPILYYIPEVIRRIALLNVREMLSSEASTFSPKTSLGFSCHLAKGVEIMMVDAPPPSSYVEDDALDPDRMDIDDASQMQTRRPHHRGGRPRGNLINGDPSLHSDVGESRAPFKKRRT